MVLRDVGRVLGLSYGHVDRICKMVPFDPSRPLTLQESIDREPRFKEEIKKNIKVKKLLELSLKLEGLNRNMATHTAGVVIAGNKLAEQFPLYIDHNSNSDSESDPEPECSLLSFIEDLPRFATCGICL